MDTFENILQTAKYCNSFKSCLLQNFLDFLSLVIMTELEATLLYETLFVYVDLPNKL